MQKITNEFLSLGVAQVPRLLGQLNRNPSSKTYGSFDRAFWHYRTNDISCARYQEAVYTLALLYCFDFAGNEYFKDEKVLEWIRASLRFTLSIQRPNGSFDEWYIHEGSFVATAFLTSALGQTMLLFKAEGIFIPEAQQLCVLLKHATSFLTHTSETTVLNQVSGAIFAVACVGSLLADDALINSADNLLEKFLSMQNAEGWWSEYGGPDIGYLSLTISYLEKYRKLTGTKRVDESIMKARAYVEAFIHPDLTAGGEYMSRNTEYIIPSRALPYLGALQPMHLDDRYLCYILYNWIDTGLVTVPAPIPKTDALQYFSQSCVFRKSEGGFFLVANGMKGGSFRLYHNGRVYYDSGLEIAHAGRVLSTGILDMTNHVSYADNTLHTSGFAKPIKEPLLDTKTMLPFKAWQVVCGRYSTMQKMLKKFLRTRMISYAGNGTIPFERTIHYSKDRVIVNDIIHAPVSLHDILFGVKASYTAVPSSKYAPVPENTNTLLHPRVEKYEKDGQVIFKRTFLLRDER